MNTSNSQLLPSEWSYHPSHPRKQRSPIPSSTYSELSHLIELEYDLEAYTGKTSLIDSAKTTEEAGLKQNTRYLREELKSSEEFYQGFDGCTVPAQYSRKQEKCYKSVQHHATTLEVNREVNMLPRASLGTIYPPKENPETNSDAVCVQTLKKVSRPDVKKPETFPPQTPRHACGPIPPSRRNFFDFKGYTPELIEEERKKLRRGKGKEIEVDGLVKEVEELKLEKFEQDDEWEEDIGKGEKEKDRRDYIHVARSNHNGVPMQCNGSRRTSMQLDPPNHQYQQPPHPRNLESKWVLVNGSAEDREEFIFVEKDAQNHS